MTKLTNDELFQLLSEKGLNPGPIVGKFNVLTETLIKIVYFLHQTLGVLNSKYKKLNIITASTRRVYEKKLVNLLQSDVHAEGEYSNGHNDSYPEVEEIEESFGDAEAGTSELSQTLSKLQPTTVNFPFKDTQPIEEVPEIVPQQSIFSEASSTSTRSYR